jgi:hypothetical protein
MTRRQAITAIGVGVALACAASSVGQPPSPPAAEPKSLLQTITEWQYPGSKLSATEAADGNTADANGDRTVPSTISKTVMVTDDPAETVLKYYKAKLTPPAKATGRAATADSGGRSVAFSDYSAGRPVTLHTVIVNTRDTSTTLVISRGKDETRTYIAWTQYRRFGR